MNNLYPFKVTFRIGEPKTIQAPNLEEACQKARTKYKREWESVTALDEACFEEVNQ